jgi:hypothetical protein
MKYEKPEVRLSEAAIWAVRGDKDDAPIDSASPQHTTSAYQADE